MSDPSTKLRDLAGLIHPADRPTIYEAADELERLQARVEALEGGLTQIAASRDMTLLGCSPDNEYPDCSADEEKAHQYGAVKAFNQCADIADATLAATEQGND